jgi:quinolinate synthase
VVISYINCSAGVKALSDIICTSSNAVRVVESVPAERPIVFAPDRHLARWVMGQTGRDMVVWPGFCVVHEQFSARRIVELQREHPNARVIAHPECEQSVLALSDHVGSTASLLRHVRESEHDEFIVATEAGILHQMRKARPGVKLVPAPPSTGCNCSLCPYMRLNTVEKVYLAMRDRRPEITVPEDLRRRALAPVERMLELG